ncbi:hypothetical protein KCP69_09995 [Salmonella enterica subsp. enterica]|nr:hypothetical protein KCP69_09995 [Salmonella enterica subsp. enterica]
MPDVVVRLVIHPRHPILRILLRGEGRYLSIYHRSRRIAILARVQLHRLLHPCTATRESGCNAVLSFDSRSIARFLHCIAAGLRRLR